ncbi:MAG: uroporphyrin-3 C-methyltransferase [Oleispira sp.]
MTDNLQQEPTTDKRPADNNLVEKKSANKSSANTTHSKPSSLLAIFALLLVIIALLAIGGIGWKGFEFSQQLLTLSHQLEQSTEKNTNLAVQLANTEKNVRLHNKQSQQNAQRIAELPGADRNDWLLAEAEYLLRLANQRLSLEKDWQGAEAILVAADNVLAEADNPLISSVRQLLAKELQALRAVPTVDLTGAVARLQAVQDQINQLEWVPRTLPQVTAVIETVAPEAAQTALDKFLTKAWAGIGTIVRIRENDKALPAPLTPDQRYYLQQNMNLMLEQAQVALVRQQEALYKQSIARTLAWLEEFSMVKDVKTTAVKETLVELSSWNVAPEFPEISGSLLKLRQLLDQQRRTVIPSTQTNTQ